MDDTKKFIIEIPEELCNYLHRLGMELEAKVFIIDRIISNHINDEDSSVLDSKIFKHYQKQYENTYSEWVMAKQELQNTLLLPQVKELTNIDKPVFNWNIDNYSDCECIITLVK